MGVKLSDDSESHARSEAMARLGIESWLSVLSRPGMPSAGLSIVISKTIAGTIASRLRFDRSISFVEHSMRRSARSTSKNLETSRSNRYLRVAQPPDDEGSNALNRRPQVLHLLLPTRLPKRWPATGLTARTTELISTINLLSIESLAAFFADSFQKDPAMNLLAV